ncbi:hypothetical protein VNO80_19775 [Phaseolus coccineus]|uniref:Uncharacterized protein n=1 Tax=Phaseolus coccineus TaxID=3886 RepID=A0AAN9MGU2_PHACN
MSSVGPLGRDVGYMYTTLIPTLKVGRWILFSGVRENRGELDLWYWGDPRRGSGYRWGSMIESYAESVQILWDDVEMGMIAL